MRVHPYPQRGRATIVFTVFRMRVFYFRSRSRSSVPLNPGSIKSRMNQVIFIPGRRIPTSLAVVGHIHGKSFSPQAA